MQKQPAGADSGSRPGSGQTPETTPLLGREAKITSHLLLKNLDRDARQTRGLDILHWHLFDESREVVLSALAMLEDIGDQRSLKHIVKLLSQPDEAVQCAAVRTLGAIRHPGSARLLLDYFKVAKTEEPRCAILEALGAACPRDEAARRLIQECAASRLVAPRTRAQAVGLMLRLGIAELDIAAQFDTGNAAIIETVLRAAAADRNVRTRVLKIIAPRCAMLSPANRRQSMDLAAPYLCPESRQILGEGLKDPDPSVRQSLYRQLGESPEQFEAFPMIVLELSRGTDPDPQLEEEVWAAIQRMERVRPRQIPLRLDIRKRIQASVREEFKALTITGRQVASDKHELGWLISRSKEYLEFYADEEFRQSLLCYLKGSYHARDRLLGELKETAVKVEVRHFDGYRALEDILKNPKRSGIGLMTRELAIAKLGKRQHLYRLIRILYLHRLLDGGDASDGAAEIFQRIYDWSKEVRLYRLTEAALYALAKADLPRAGAACMECLTPPVFSKICTIAAIRMLHELEWERVEPAVISLLSDSDDPHILINLIDGLERVLGSAHNEINQCLVRLLRDCGHLDVARRAADFLSVHATFTVFESLVDIYERADSSRQELILIFLERMRFGNGIFEREGVVEFLYKILRREEGAHRAKAALLLWNLGDDLAPRLLTEFFSGGNPADIITILHGLRGLLKVELVRPLLPLFGSDHAGVHEALREVVAAVRDHETRNALFELILSSQELGSAEGRESRMPEELRVDFFEEKKAYRFEREYIQELAILFTDIQGYAKKAESLSNLQLTALLQGYEGILLPTITGHGGELIKRMGDGHLFVFSAGLDAALAAIRVQKALKRFNSYREEKQRIVIRVGIHYGKVVRREGDVLGSTVNIASRLERAAAGGSILVSENLHRQIREYVHARDLGPLEIKGISEPIRVFEPYEIVLDLPRELDPLEKAQHPGKLPASPAGVPPSGVPPAGVPPAAVPPAAVRSGGDGSSQPHRAQGGAVVLNSAALAYLVATFASLNRLCLQVESGQSEPAEIRGELARRWLKLKPILISGRSPGAGPGANP